MADQRSAKQGGYALLIVAATMVAAGGTALLGRIPEQIRNAERGQQTDVTTQLESLRTAILRFGRLHRRLPCPAEGAATGQDAGLEQRSQGRCAITESASAAVDSIDGVIPWRTLGLSKESALDPWGHLFAYVVYQGDDGRHADLAAASGLDPLGCAAGSCPFWDLDRVPNPLGELLRLTASPGTGPPAAAQAAKQRLCDAMAAAVVTEQDSIGTGDPRPIGFDIATVCARDTVDCSRLRAGSEPGHGLDDRAAFYILSYGPEGQGGWSGYGARVSAAGAGARNTIADDVIGSVSVSALFDSLGVPTGALSERFCALDTTDLAPEVSDVLAEAAEAAGLIPDRAAFASVFATAARAGNANGHDSAGRDAETDEAAGDEGGEAADDDAAADGDGDAGGEAGDPAESFYAEGLSTDDADDGDNQDDDCFIQFDCENE